ncbi:MAG: restriction endonuclease subunit S [Anaerolineaceae bacterium]|nr:restriction endonuclease subunit S [Anaerolineaceae bacterium]
MSNKSPNSKKFSPFPQDWKVVKISDLLENRILISHLDGNHGGEYPRSDEFVSNGIPYISANSILSGYVDFSKCKFLSPKRADKIRKGIAKNGDVLFAHNATVGPVALLETDEPRVILSTTLTYFRCDEKVLHNYYLKAFLETDFFKRQYERIMAQSTRNQVPITTQRKFNIAFPPLPEQRKIAKILSTWDEAIAKTEQLIEALRKRKKGLMQRLLTGQVRFPGFEDEWKHKKLEEILELNYGRSPKKIQETEGNYAIFGTGGIIGKSNNYLCDQQSLIIGRKGSIDQPQLALEPFWATDTTFYGTPDYQIDLFFLYYLLSFKGLSQYNEGSTLPSLSRTTLNSLIFLIPEFNEQQKISSILIESDKAIDYLHQIESNYKIQKKALMQRLLTGQVRVKVE